MRTAAPSPVTIRYRQEPALGLKSLTIDLMGERTECLLEAESRRLRTTELQMRSDKRNRWVKYVTICSGATPSDFGHLIDLRRILRAAQEALDDGPIGRKPKGSARIHIRIVDVRFSKKARYCALLFRQVDKDGQDAVYEDFESGDVDAHPKKHGQGNRATAHLLIDLKGKLKGHQTHHPALLEVVQGVSPTVVKQRLTSIAATYAQGIGRIGTEECRYRGAVEVHPFVDRTIREELKQGVLDHFVLVHHIAKSNGLDERNMVMERERKLELKVTGPNASEFLDPIWAAVRKKAKEGGYELVRAYYEADSGTKASTAINTQKAEALEDLVAKHGKITLEKDMHPKQTQAEWHFVRKMIRLLKKSGKKKAK